MIETMEMKNGYNSVININLIRRRSKMRIMRSCESASSLVSSNMEICRHKDNSCIQCISVNCSTKRSCFIQHYIFLNDTLNIRNCQVN